MSKELGSWDAFPLDDRWRFHAYDYGWRRAYLGDPESPLDRERLWFDSLLVGQAEEMFRGQTVGDESIAWELASRWFSRNDQYDSVTVRRGSSFYAFRRTADRNIILHHVSSPQVLR